MNAAATKSPRRIETDFMKAVAVLIARIFAASVANGLVSVSPFGQASIDVVFVGMDERALGDAGQDERLYRGLFDVGQHFDRDLAAALNDPEDRRLFLLQRAASARALQPVAAPRAAFFSNGFGVSLVAGVHIDLVDLDFARQDDGRRPGGET